MARRYSGLGSFGPGPASGTSGYGGSPSYGTKRIPLSGRSGTRQATFVTKTSLIIQLRLT